MIPVRLPTLDALIDAALVEWYEYRAGYRLSVGHRAESPTASYYQTPTHWDWKNGAVDARADGLRIRGICDAMDAVPDHPRRWRTALSMQARNLHCGNSVWRSQVLPADRAELDVLLLEARNRFAVELRSHGVIE